MKHLALFMSVTLLSIPAQAVDIESLQMGTAIGDACPGPAREGFARCMAKVRLNKGGGIFAAATPSGWGAHDLQAAYNIPGGGAGVTVAIVDAQDNPNAEADMAVYRAQFGLPPCTTANGCFRKVNQNGQAGPLPSADVGWSGEIALDLDMVSAGCPACKILLVEANSSMMSDLGASVNTAVSLGAKIVSNSYGGSESGNLLGAEHFFNHPGVSILVSSGDSGYGASYPASSQYVTAVGGTSLVRDATSPRGWREAAWELGGSGCSKVIPKPAWQNDPDCKMRTLTDVSAVADPNTGVSVYHTYGGGDWKVYGGTSASAPLVAAIYAATSNAGIDGSYAYSHSAAFYQVSSGSNGEGNSYLCNAKPGYNGPAGWGTPNGSVLSYGGGLAPQPAPPAGGGSCKEPATPPPVISIPISCKNGGGAYGWIGGRSRASVTAMHLLVANPTAQSGSNAARIDVARALMRRVGLAHDFVPTLPHGGTVAAVRDALRDGDYDVVVYMGGDGTFAEVAKGLLASGRDVALGMLPTGTANDQGKSFGLDTDVERNVAVLKANARCKLDAVSIRAGQKEDMFFDSAGWGISPRVLKLRNQDRKAIEAVPVLRAIWKDHVVYAGALLRTFLASYVDDDKFDVTVTADGVRTEWTGLTDLIVKNTRIYGGAWVFDRGSLPDDGRVEVVPFAGKRDWLSKAIVHLDGNPVTPEALELVGVSHSESLSAADIVLEFAPRSADVPFLAQIDGEEFPASERVEIKVLQAAITLVVP